MLVTVVPQSLARWRDAAEPGLVSPRRGIDLPEGGSTFSSGVSTRGTRGSNAPGGELDDWGRFSEQPSGLLTDAGFPASLQAIEADSAGAFTSSHVA
jgi:hypothetical protein